MLLLLLLLLLRLQDLVCKIDDIYERLDMDGSGGLNFDEFRSGISIADGVGAKNDMVGNLFSSTFRDLSHKYDPCNRHSSAYCTGPYDTRNTNVARCVFHSWVGALPQEQQERWCLKGGGERRKL